MRVHHYHFGKDGGAERFFTQFVNALHRRGVDQSVVIRPGRQWRAEIENAVTIVESNFRNFSPDRFFLPRMVMRSAKQKKPDALMSWAPRAAELMPSYPSCIKIARLGDYPTKLRYFKNVDVIVCNTPGIAEQVKGLGWTRGIEIISNFTDTRSVAPIEFSQVDKSHSLPVIFSAGRFVRRKGFHTLIEALAKIPDAVLWLAGDGEERLALEKLAITSGVGNRVRFLGWLPDVRPYISAADIFVMPSIHEPLGNVILEAWAQKKPVVSSKSEGPMWFMRDEENGLLAEIGEVESFADAITRLLGDQALSQRVAAGGHETLMQQFSEEAVSSAYIELFKRKP